MSKTSSLAQELPAYLGFGTLDPASVSDKADKTTATFQLDGEAIYQVALGKSQCVIKEFFDGRELGKSTHATLKEAFTHHLMSSTPYENQRFERLYHQVCDNRNIHIEFADQPETIFFPAGYIFVLRQPIVASNRAKWKSLKAELARANDSAPLQFDAEHKGVIFRLGASGTVKTEQVILVDCTAPLLHVAAAADWLWQSGIVPPEQAYRLAVLDASLSLPGQMRLYAGKPGQGVKMFSVCVVDEMDMKQAARLFRDSSKQFLAGLQA